MKRYILLFNNGYLVQQDGLNLTYLNLFEMEILKMLIDTKEGKVIRGEKWDWKLIQSYHDSTLITEINKEDSKK
ncbi:MAG: hypothetical protein ACFFC1_12580 [Promethearchaeota archaeon]